MLPMTTLTQLNQRFALAQTARFEADAHGLTRLVINTPQAQAHIYLLGAHVTHWQPAGHKPVLFMSGSSWFEVGKPIRGGVPVCWPWFGPREGHPEAPNHGFARLAQWEVELLTLDPAGRVVVQLLLRDSDASRQQWPYAFALRHRITVGSTLTLALETQNLSDTPMTLTEALHTYFAVGDIRQVGVSGLENRAYLSKVQGGVFTQPNEPIRFTGETDRVFEQHDGLCLIDDPALGRRISIDKAGSRSTVVWNPWIAKSKAMPDYGDDEWPGMVCVETANALGDAVTIAPGGKHEIRATVEVR